ncbi:MAG: hypothetical protein AAF577_11880 [Pseudomonadota bacterium]
MNRLRQTLMAFATILLATASAPSAVAAQSDTMSEGEFRDYVEGYTLYFERDGVPWGRESFRAGGGVTWQYPSGSCLDGVWRAYDEGICFYYGPGTEVLCWSMHRQGEGIIGRLTRGDDIGLELSVTRRDRVPLVCGEAEGL